MMTTLIFTAVTAVLLPATLFAVVIPTHANKKGCTSSMDIVFVLDGSDSVSAPDFYMLKRAIHATINKLELGAEQVNVGIVVFSTTISMKTPLTYNRQMLQDELDNAIQPRDGTATYLAIEAMIRMLKKGRPKVPKVAIIVTDGLSKNTTKTTYQATRAKNQNINMFSVGVGLGKQAPETLAKNKRELLAIASNGKQVLELKKFNQLHKSLTELMKVVCPCPKPPGIRHATINDDEKRAIGSVFDYSCFKGYMAFGRSSIQCMPDAAWSKTDFSCRGCNKPMRDAGTAVLIPGGKNIIGSVRTYACKKEFATPVFPTVTCIATPTGPKWTRLNNTCSQCGPPTQYAFGYYEDSTDTSVGATRRFYCNPGFIETGKITVTCRAAKGIAGWTKLNNNCIQCIEPMPPNNAVYDVLDTRVNGKTTFKCMSGYIPNGRLESTCIGDRSKGIAYWSKLDFQCIDCVTIPIIPNAKTIGQVGASINQVVKYKCNPKYHETAPIIRTCLGLNFHAFWNETSSGICVDCGEPAPIINTKLMDGANFVGEERALTCVDGFIPSLPMAIKCQPRPGGPVWVRSKGRCITCPPPEPTLPNAVLDPTGRNFVNGYRLYNCIDGFTTSPPNAGPIKRKCIGEIDSKHVGHVYWGPPSHTCEGCLNLPKVANANVPDQFDIRVGATVRFQCKQGFYETGAIVAVCETHGAWRLSTHDCTACGPVHGVPNAVIVRGPSSIGSVRYYECDPRFTPNQEPATICEKNSRWRQPTFKCITCDAPADVLNAVTEPGTNYVNEVRSFTCLPDYLQTGVITSKCTVPKSTPKNPYPRPVWSSPVNFCKDCGLPHPVDNTRYIKWPQTIGTRIKYECLPEFVPTGPTDSYCTQEGQWTLPKFRCIACEYPQNLNNATVDVWSNNHVGSITSYKCDEGLLATGLIKYVCFAEPNFSKPYWKAVNDHYCTDCGVPSIEHGFWEPGPTIVGSVATFKCAAGYVPAGVPEMYCTADARWDFEFACKGCSYPPELPFATMVSSFSKEDWILIGTKMVYHCLPGYYAAQEVSVTCELDRSWIWSVSQCTGCGVPTPIDNGWAVTPPGKVGVDPVYTTGTVMPYQCNEYYEPVGSPANIQCLPTAQWSQPGFTCMHTCQDPVRLNNATVDTKLNNHVGSVMSYKCDTGLLAIGRIEYVCFAETPLSRPYWKAISNNYCTDCGVPSIEHGFWEPGPTTIGSVATFKCAAGYVPAGVPEMYCTADARWDFEFACKGCSYPPELPFATVVTPFPKDDWILVGITLAYQCSPGYYAPTEVSATCELDRSWRWSASQCNGCRIPPPIKDGFAVIPKGATVDTVYTTGTTIPYTCEKNYVAVGGLVSVECLYNAEWGLTDFTCVLTCYDPPKYTDATLQPGGDNLLGMTRTYRCDDRTFMVGNPVTECLPTGLWRDRQFECKVCGNPQKQPFSLVPAGPNFVGDVVHYVCDPGYAPTGDTSITCLSNATWSKPHVGCSKCKPAKRLENTLTPDGPSFVDTVITYTCMKGFISEQNVTSICQANLTWSEPQFKCHGCGIPPKLINGYSSLGGRTIGSTKTYQCNSGYELSHRRSNEIKCLKTGQWSPLKVTCNVRTTTTTTPRPTVEVDPSICDDCKMLNGVGFNRHPFDCTKFVQCHFLESGLIAVYQPCAEGTYWDQERLTCDHINAVDCPNERCSSPKLVAYKHADSTKCCAYWECKDGKSVPKCCGTGFSFKPGKGCVPDKNCTALCPGEERIPACNLKPSSRMNEYLTFDNGIWKPMPCPAGLDFSIITCACSQPNQEIIPGFVCKPELQMNFDNGRIEDASSYNVHVLNENVIPYDKAAYFNGYNSRLIINRFSNTAFHGTLVIKLRYKEQLKGPTAGSLQALISNGDCDDDPSVIVAKMPKNVLCGARTDEAKSFALPTVNKPWKEVIYIHDEKQLEGKVCGASYSKWSWGPIAATHCAIHIGYGTNMANFMGLMDDISIYQCRPVDRVLSVYGGRRDRGKPRSPIVH